jgi:uncharacterized membrane protein YcaP (DUF421 family)
MGKRQIGEMQPFEFIVTLVIADLACIPMADTSIPLLYGVISVLTLFILHQVFSLLEQASDKIKGVISGKPSIVINKDGVNIKELRKNNMNIDDLIESMRNLGYFSLDELDYAIFESNGKLSAFESKNKNGDTNSLPLLIVDSGKTVNRNLKILGCTEKDVISFITKNGAKLKDVEVITIDGNGRTYFKIKNQKYKILNYNLKGNVKW